MSRNTKQAAMLAASVVLLTGTTAFLGIASYGDPEYKAQELEKLRYYMVPAAEQKYADEYSRVLRAGRDSAKQERERKMYEFKMQRAADAKNFAAEYEEYAARLEKEYNEMNEEYMTREDVIINEMMSKDSALRAATENMKFHHDWLERAKRDSAAFAQKYNQQTFGERISNNFDEFKRDYNNARIKFHQKRLQELQKFKQERSR